MSTLGSSAAEPSTDRRFRVSWMKKKIPLKNSVLFSKANYSEEWHQAIDEIAGTLHPTDPSFPYLALRQATDTYLNKKGKITTQEDTDLRLSILIDVHTSKYVAIAATAHIVSATYLRSILQAELNVAHGNYWGLESWLHSVIAANHLRPTTVTSLEAFWAHKLLPFATHGPGAAGSYLENVCKILREYPTPNLNAVPEFAVLVHRALSDVAVHLEGLRFKCDWAAARAATSWMVELRRTPVVMVPGSLLPEHILDSSFPVWRIWAHWRPDVDLITHLGSLDKDYLAILPDIMTLEGPDFVTGKEISLKEGLVAQYAGKVGVVKFQGLMFEVPNCAKNELWDLLERLTKALDFSCTAAMSETCRKDLLKLFAELTVTRPISTETLGLFEVVSSLAVTPKNNIYNAVREVYTAKDELGGRHVFALQSLLQAFTNPHSESLRKILLTPWLVDGIINCFEECRAAVKTQIEEHLPWTQLALDFHGFCVALDSAKEIIALETDLNCQIHLPVLVDIEMAINIYEAARVQRSKPPRHVAAPDITEQEDCSVDTPKSASDSSVAPQYPLEMILETYYLHHLLDQREIDYSSSRSIEAIFRVWKSTSDPNIDTGRREFAILVAKNADSDFILRCRCLEEIAAGHKLSLPNSFISDALEILQKLEDSKEQTIIDFINLLSRHKASGRILSQCWRDFAYRWLEQDPKPSGSGARNLLTHLLKTMAVAEIFQFIDTVENLFADTLAAQIKDFDVPALLQPELLSWKNKLADYKPTLTRLEAVLGQNSAAMYCILSRHQVWAKSIIDVLKCLRDAEGRVMEPLLQKIAGRMSEKSKSSRELLNCISSLRDASAGTVEACMKIWDGKYGILNLPAQPAGSKDITPQDPVFTPRYIVPLSVVEVMVAGWMQDNETDLDKVAIHAVACISKIRVYNFDLPKDKLEDAARFWEKVQIDLIREAERLETLQKALMAVDPAATAALLVQLGVIDNSWIDAEIRRLPACASTAVKRKGDNRISMSFPLTAYKPLQRSAMGIPTLATGLVVLIFFGQSVSNSSSFCIHYDNEPDIESKEHSPYLCEPYSLSPSEVFCTPTQTAFGWQISRAIHHQLDDDNTGIVVLYNRISELITLPGPGQACVSCGASHNVKDAQLRRSTPCNLSVCAKLWYKLPLEVRIPEIRTDTFAVDLMLTSVYSAAVATSSQLLSDCPITDFGAIKMILDRLPSMVVMRDAVHLSVVLSKYHKDAEKLISWACVHHRGLVATADGPCRIPGLPRGTHQFILAHASPKIEGAFVSRLPHANSKSTVLFHGTSFDRLPAILSEGLRVFSDTPLMSNGAQYGNGIYLAAEPRLSISYSRASLSWKNSGLNSMRLVLGCEVVGSGQAANKDVHVITDPASVMVRYMFLFPSDSYVPKANQIVSSMATSMRYIRDGKV